MTTPRNQIGVSFSTEDLERIDKAVQRYRKDNRAAVMRELYMLFFDVYVEAEEAKLAVLQQRIDLKHPASKQKK